MSDGTSRAPEVRRDNPADPGELRLTWVSHTDRSSTGVVDIAPGGGLRLHVHHFHDEVITILEGEVEFRFGDETKVVEPADVITVPAGTVHAPVHSSEGCLMVSVFAPWFDPDNPDRIFVDD